MTCKKCSEHRAAIKAAVKSASPLAVSQALTQAGVALARHAGENAGRRLTKRPK